MTQRTPIETPVRLADLIAAIEGTNETELDRLVNAVLVAEHLGELSDHLIGHFVDAARKSGASWAEIGAGLGVTKQAAQKRFVPRPGAGSTGGFERFTPSAGNVVVAAQNAAHARANDIITPGHLVLGLLAADDSFALRILADFGVDPEAVRAAAEASLPASAETVPALVPFDADAKKALELAVRESLQLDHSYVGTEHLLLALAGDGPSGEFFSGDGFSRDAARERIVALIATVTGA